MTSQIELEFLEAHKRDSGYETNFAVKKFLELPPAEQEALRTKIMSDESRGRRNSSGFRPEEP